MTLTTEQAANREILIQMGHAAGMLDSGVFRPDEFEWLIQESLMGELLDDDEDGYEDE